MQKDSDNFPNFIILLIIGIIAYTFFFSSGQEISFNDLDLSSENLSVEMLSDPIQERYGENDYITINKKNIELKIYPKAQYRIYAMVMSKHRYRLGWEGKIAPYDLALAWDKLMLPEYQKGIRYSQGNRWYHYRYDAGYPLPKSYISSHSSNHHIIPGNDNLKKALGKIRVKEKVYLEGYLVHIKGKVKGREVWWNSSLTRKDSGNHACEILYLTKAIAGNKVYE
ncbi:MAG: hypothetical protein KAQ92_08270 [Candidatus Aenigmarchaeota archaeon]|nr:hypothetical protein [Candidatus Aenigmarchaeota archaeon]